MTIRVANTSKQSAYANRSSNKDDAIVVAYADAKLSPNGGAGIGAPVEQEHQLPVAQLAPMNQEHDDYYEYFYPATTTYCTIVSPAAETSQGPTSGDVTANNSSKVTTTAITWIPQPLPDEQPQDHHQSYSCSSSSSGMPNVPRPNFEKMKRRRVRAQLLAGTAGAVVGLVFLGPLGALVCGFAGNKLVKGVAKTRENRLKASYQRELAAAQVAAASSPVPAYAAKVA